VRHLRPGRVRLRRRRHSRRRPARAGGFAANRGGLRRRKLPHPGRPDEFILERQPASPASACLPGINSADVIEHGRAPAAMERNLLHWAVARTTSHGVGGDILVVLDGGLVVVDLSQLEARSAAGRSCGPLRKLTRSGLRLVPEQRCSQSGVRGPPRVPGATPHPARVTQHPARLTPDQSRATLIEQSLAWCDLG
jgi:hypothetical protein